MTPGSRSMHGFATIDINASPEAVSSLISDVTQIGRFSPETFEAQWVDGAVGPAVGAKFRGHVRRNEKGPIYWTACTVTECDPGRGIRLPRAVTAVGASHCTAQHGTGHVALSPEPDQRRRYRSNRII